MQQPKNKSVPAQRFFVIATEPSADALGADIIAGLNQKFPDAEFKGIGGPLMEKEGCFVSMVPMASLALMNPVMIIKRLFFFWRLIQNIPKEVQQWQSTALITIDGSELCLRISRRVQGCPRIHCVAPTVWAWRPGRARNLHKKIDHLLCLFPFEPPFFSTLPCYYVGHPLYNSITGNLSDFHAAYPAITHPVVCLLPGSRVHEITTLLPLFWRVSQDLKSCLPQLSIVIVTLPSLRPLIEKLCPHSIIIDTEKGKRDTFAASTIALAASGTVSLELAIHGLPMVIAYRVHWLTALLMKCLLKTKWVSLINILSQDTVIPEHLQSQCSVSALKESLLSFLKNQKKIEEQKYKLKKLIKNIRPNENFKSISSNIIYNILKKSE